MLLMSQRVKVRELRSQRAIKGAIPPAPYRRLSQTGAFSRLAIAVRLCVTELLGTQELRVLVSQ